MQEFQFNADSIKEHEQEDADDIITLNLTKLSNVKKLNNLFFFTYVRQTWYIYKHFFSIYRPIIHKHYEWIFYFKYSNGLPILCNSVYLFIAPNNDAFPSSNLINFFMISKWIILWWMIWLFFQFHIFYKYHSQCPIDMKHYR